MTLRERMLRAVADTYPFDADQEYADDESEIPMAAFDRDGELYRFVLVQDYHNGRTWHAFADTVAELMEYQEGEEDPWVPVLVADLDTGATANVHMSARIDEFGKGPYTFDPVEVEEETNASPNTHRVMFGPRGWQDFPSEKDANAFAAKQRREHPSSAEWGIAVVPLDEEANDPINWLNQEELG